MHSISGFLRTIILLGAVQGFVLSVLLYFSARKRKSDGLPNRLLAGMIFLIALASFSIYGTMQGWFDSSLFMRVMQAIVPMIVIMPIGPLIFFYIKSSLDPDFRLSKKDRRHFYPVIIDLIPQLTALIFIIGILTQRIRNNPLPWGQFIDAYNVYSDIPRWISISAYVWLAGKHLAAQKLPRPKLNWLRQFLLVLKVYQSIWLIYLIPYVIPRFTDQVLNSVDWYPLYVPFAVIIYWLGIKGYIISFREFPVKQDPRRPPSVTDDLAQQYITTLESAMKTDRLYLDPALTVTSLATHTGLVQKTISAVLNQHMGKSFNEFVNEYRINEVKERLLKPESKSLTIAGLAYECGFNSQPTFQRAFKAIMGCSPREFQSTSAQIRN
jgi:AraC-like DNA-binding protein